MIEAKMKRHKNAPAVQAQNLSEDCGTANRPAAAKGSSSVDHPGYSFLRKIIVATNAPRQITENTV